MASVTVPLLDLTRQNRMLQTELEGAIRRVVVRGRFILGPEVAHFEKEFARFCGSRFAVGVASGSDALELSLRVLGVGPGDRVATVSFTFLATVDAILQVGARPLFIDIDPRTYTMDPQSLEERIARLPASHRRSLKAILPVHLFGQPCDMGSLLTLAKREGLAVVEDVAQAAGARWRGQPVGSLGALGCFSFFPSKTLGCFGDGGMVVTDSAEYAQRLQELREHGCRAGGLKFRFGRNSRLDELQAAILRVKLSHFPQWISRRQRWARAYTDSLLDVDGLQCPGVLDGTGHAFCLYVVRTRRRQALRKRLNDGGIATGVYYSPPVHRQPIYRSLFRTLSLPVTEAVSREVLALPLFPELRQEEVQRVCRVVRQAMAR